MFRETENVKRDPFALIAPVGLGLELQQDFGFRDVILCRKRLGNDILGTRTDQRAFAKAAVGDGVGRAVRGLRVHSMAFENIRMHECYWKIEEFKLINAPISD